MDMNKLEDKLDLMWRDTVGALSADDIAGSSRTEKFARAFNDHQGAYIADIQKLTGARVFPAGVDSKLYVPKPGCIVD